MLSIIKKVPLCLLLLSFAFCKHEPRPDTERSLVGTYQLVIGSGFTAPEKPRQETLELQANHVYVQVHTTELGATSMYQGTWRYQDRHVWLSRWHDFTGFVGPYGSEQNVNLIVEFGQRPVILLHPDTNTYYQRTTVSGKS